MQVFNIVCETITECQSAVQKLSSVYYVTVHHDRQVPSVPSQWAASSAVERSPPGEQTAYSS